MNTKIRMSQKVGAVLLGIILFSGNANALWYRISIIHEMQAESHTRAGYEDVMYIYQTGAWLPNGSPSGSCDPTWAYFNAKENAHFVALLLTARMSEKQVKVYVDETKPKLGSICQVINIDF